MMPLRTLHSRADALAAHKRLDEARIPNHVLASKRGWIVKVYRDAQKRAARVLDQREAA